MRFPYLPLFTLLLLSFPASALPGTSVTPQSLNLNVRSAQASRLVLLSDAHVSQVEAYRSQSGHEHLKFQITVAGVRYGAIEFDTPYSPAVAAGLQRGPVRLIGVWDSYQGEPSFTVLKVLGEPVSSATAGTLLRIDDAVISLSSIEKYTSAAHKVHVLYRFKVGTSSYQGVIYDGDWTSATLATLRSGHATLYGSWSKYRNQPSFVTRRVAP